MKTKRILFSLLAVLSTIFGITVNASTTAPSSYVVSSSDYYKIKASNYLNNSTISFDYKKNTNGDIIYCTEINDLSVKSGTQTYYLNKELDSRFAYVLANGYPNRVIFDGGEKDYFTTALTIWYLSDSSDPVFKNFNVSNGTYNGSYSDVVSAMRDLINSANSYSYTNPSIKVNTQSNNLTLSSDGKYYVSSNIGITKVGSVGSYKVSLENAPSGTIITDKDGNAKTTFSSSQMFIVKVPVASINELKDSFKVNISATGSIDRAYLYTPAEAKYQNTAVLYPEYINVSTSTSLKANIVTKVSISKVDITNGSELPGATLVVRDSNKKVVDEWVSGNEPHVIEGLNPGKYTLTETNAPNGYVLSSETITFEVKADGTTTMVKMENAPKEPSVVYISKQDATTSEEIAGAKLEVKNEKGEVVEAWVSTTEPHKIEGLEPGKYYLTETLAPEGYELSTETVEFVVKEDGTVDGKVIMYNKPETVIVVPSTGSFKTIWTSLIGIIVIGLGSLVIYKNYKKNEQK